MRETLSVMVIHDIKNSLALLEADLEQLNHRADAADESLKAYKHCIELKNRLINFLTLYKLEQADAKPNIAEVDLEEFLQDMISGSQSVMMGRKHGRAIEVRVDEDKISIDSKVKHKGVASFDEYLVDLAIESALNNAVRYAASTVSLWFEQTENQLAFFVYDDGPGISPSIHHDHKEFAEKESSTGLGMTLCKAVTAAHGGGKVSLENVPESGALFTLELNFPG